MTVSRAVRVLGAAALIGLGLGAAASAQPYGSPPGYAPPPGYDRGPPPGYDRPPPPGYDRRDIDRDYGGPPGFHCEAFLHTPGGPRRLFCPIGEPRPLGARCHCDGPPPAPGYPPYPPAFGHVIR